MTADSPAPETITTTTGKKLLRYRSPQGKFAKYEALTAGAMGAATKEQGDSASGSSEGIPLGTGEESDISDSTDDMPTRGSGNVSNNKPAIDRLLEDIVATQLPTWIRDFIKTLVQNQTSKTSSPQPINQPAETVEQAAASDDFEPEKDQSDMDSAAYRTSDQGLKHIVINQPKAKLKNGNFAGQDIHNSILYGADLQEASFAEANLEGVDLRCAQLQKACFISAYLGGADLRGTNLQGADLTNAYLHGAWLQLADLSDTDFSRAKLDGAHMSQAQFDSIKSRSKNVTGSADLAEAAPSDEARVYEIQIPNEYRGFLFHILIDRFSGNELNTLCLELNVDCDNLPEPKERKAGGLLRHLENRKRIHELVEIGSKSRSDICWHYTPQQTMASRAAVTSTP
jgi:hypothetical protein